MNYMFAISINLPTNRYDQTQIAVVVVFVISNHGFKPTELFFNPSS